RVEPRVDHRLGLFVPRQRVGRGGRRVGDGVADVDVGEVLDLGHEVADLTAVQLVARRHAGAEDADVGDLESPAVPHQLHLLAGAEHAALDPDVNDDPLVRVE